MAGKATLKDTLDFSLRTAGPLKATVGCMPVVMPEIPSFHVFLFLLRSGYYSHPSDTTEGKATIGKDKISLKVE